MPGRDTPLPYSLCGSDLERRACLYLSDIRQVAKQSVSVRPFSPKARFTRRNCCKNWDSSGALGTRTVGSNAIGTPSLLQSHRSVSDALCSFYTSGSGHFPSTGHKRASLTPLQFFKNFLVTWTNYCGQTGDRPFGGPCAWRQVPQMWPG